jgi:hypothetical protein
MIITTTIAIHTGEMTTVDGGGQPGVENTGDICVVLVLTNNTVVFASFPGIEGLVQFIKREKIIFPINGTAARLRWAEVLWSPILVRLKIMLLNGIKLKNASFVTDSTAMIDLNPMAMHTFKKICGIKGPMNCGRKNLQPGNRLAGDIAVTEPAT